MNIVSKILHLAIKSLNIKKHFLSKRYINAFSFSKGFSSSKTSSKLRQKASVVSKKINLTNKSSYVKASSISFREPFFSSQTFFSKSYYPGWTSFSVPFDITKIVSSTGSTKGELLDYKNVYSLKHFMENNFYENLHDTEPLLDRVGEFIALVRLGQTLNYSTYLDYDYEVIKHLDHGLGYDFKLKKAVHMKLEGFQYSPIVKFDDFKWDVLLPDTASVLSNNTPTLYSIGVPSITPLSIKVLFQDYLTKDFTDNPYSPWLNTRLFYIIKKDNAFNQDYYGEFGGDFEVLEPGVSYNMYLFSKETTNVDSILGI